MMGCWRTQMGFQCHYGMPLPPTPPQGLVDPHSERSRLHTRILSLQRRLRALTPGPDPTSSSPHQRQVGALIN